MAHDSYIPPVLDAALAEHPGSDYPSFGCVIPGQPRRTVVLPEWDRSLTPRSVPTVRPDVDPCAAFEQLVREEGEGYARLAFQPAPPPPVPSTRRGRP